MVTFLRGLAGGVPSGECELYLVCRADTSGRAARAVGRVARDTEAHDLARVFERYMCTL
jgi:hypothetical protein